MGRIRPENWVGKWLNDGRPTPASDAEFYKEDPAPRFRRKFRVQKPLVRARLYISGLGYYQASLNGARVGDHVLDPGWTNFGKKVFYSVYDVTRQLQAGENCLGVELGNGWYNPLPLRLFGSFNLRDHLAIGRPRFIAQLRLDYQDGSSEMVMSDNKWRVGSGPVRRNDIYLGEWFDAQQETPGWDRVAFDDSVWSAPGVATEKVGPLVAQPLPPVRVTEEWSAVKVTEPRPGVLIYDCGKNFAGWVRVKHALPRGTVVHLRYGELLHPDGTLNPMTSVAGQIKGTRKETGESIGGPGAPPIAWQTDTFVARGGEDSFTPRFTFHAFRYVEITGIPSPLPVSNITAMRLNTDVATAGAFECSNPLLNEIQAMCRNTFLSNIFSVQSDCPHRERLGYGGDIVATSEAFVSNFDMATFYAKAVEDWSESARPDGMLTDTAPFMGIQYCGLAWAMAHPLLIDQLYRYYGNRQIGEAEYATAKRWMALVEKQYPDGIVTDGLSDHESLTENPAPEMVTPLYFVSANLLAEQASRRHLKADETHYRQLAEKIRTAYRRQFVNGATGRVGPGTQASQAFALYTGIVTEAERAKVLAYLIQEIHARKDHLSTGIMGTKFMLDVLSREGHADLAYKIVTQPDFPGWGWMLKNGATTLWEHWEYSDNTFSHNHPMFGSVSQWMMQWLGGIQPETASVGFDRIVVRPQVPKDLDWVKSHYDSIRGRIVSNWQRRDDSVRFEIEIPVNTQARVVLPVYEHSSVSEGGRPLEGTPGVTDVVQRGNTVELTAGSGRYVFTVRRNGR
jgi:alpha-L-rhamnosidase